MSAALDLLQWRHDMAEPECETKFIDTAEGHSWACGIADDLMACKPLVIGGKEVIKAFDLADKLSELVAGSFDPHNNFNAMILYAATGQGDKAKAAFEAFMGEKYVENLAYEMAAEHAEAYAAERGEDDYE